jgi:hypothetical protein
MSGTGRHVCPHRVYRVAVAVLFFLVGGIGLSAHNVTPDPTVEVFLRVTRDHLAVKVWLPMIALSDANLPRTPDGHLAQDQIRPALDVVARGLARDLELQQGDSPLSAPSVATTLSPDESFLAIDLDYAVPGDQADLSARFHTFRSNGQLIATQVHYVVDDRRTRTFVVDGPPQRISFAPTVIEVVRHFVDEGSDVLFEGADFLLLAVCLVAVGRIGRTLGAAVASVLAGQALTVLLAAGGLLALSPTVMSLCAALAASAVVVLAIQDVTSPASRWLSPLCFAFGTMNGADVAARLLHDWGFTGDHAVAGLLGFLLTVSIGELWVIAILGSAAGLIRRRGRIAELAVLSAAIFAGHAALHRVIDQGQALADAGTYTLDRFLFTVTIGWALLIVCAGMLDTILSAGAGTRSRLLTRPGTIETR